MADVTSILPPNATELERNVEQSATGAIEQLPVPIRDLWNPDKCPVALLPWLAWALDVEQWQSDWPEITQRAAIKASVSVHNHMGTSASMVNALEALGYAPVRITEFINLFHRSSESYNGRRTHVGTTLAFQFDVEVNNNGAIPSVAAIAKIREAINEFRNVRSHLHNLYYNSIWHNGGNTHDGAITRDGGLILG